MAIQYPLHDFGSVAFRDFFWAGSSYLLTCSGQDEGWMAGALDDMSDIMWDKSVLNFEESEKRQMENLQRFFAMAVEWPRLLPLTRLLTKLPKNRLFWLINKLWKGYVLRTRVHLARFSLRGYIEIIRHYMRIRS